MINLILIGNLKNPERVLRILKANLKFENYIFYADITSGLKGQFGEQEVYDYKKIINLIKKNKNLTICQISGRFVFYQILEAIKKNLGNIENHIYFSEFKSNKENLDIYGTQGKKIYGIDVIPYARGFFEKESAHSAGSTEKCLSNNKIDSALLADPTACDLSAIRNDDWSEPYIANFLLRNLSDQHALFISNSMAARYCDQYFSKSSRTNQVIPIGTNRGLSGIDGIISTACGYFKGLDKRGVLLIGDQTFIHDSNGLEFLKYLSKPMLILLINNSGCKIFSHLPIAKHKEIHEKYFYAEHNYKLSGFSKVFENLNLDHKIVKTKFDFEKELSLGLELNAHRVIEVQI